MKFTLSTVLVINALRELLPDSPEGVCGAQVTKHTQLLSGTVYPILRRMEDRGYLKSKLEETTHSHCGRRVRHCYSLTDSGLELLPVVEERLKRVRMGPDYSAS